MELEASVIDCRVPQPDERAERELIERARRDPEAFTRLYRMHYARIAGYLQRRTGCRAVTEDLLSDVFLIVLKRLPRYECREAPFRFWLYRIASNAVNQWARSERRRRRRDARHAAEQDRRRSGRDEEDDPNRDRVREALLSLSPQQQTLLVLHYREQLDIEHLAIVHGRPPGTIKSRLHRAREALRAALNER